MSQFEYQLRNSLPQFVYALLLIIAALLLAYAAKLTVKQIFRKKGLDDKFRSGEEGPSVSAMTGNLVFLIVLLFFLPGILTNLGLGFISEPFSGMLRSIYSFLPNILGAVLVLIFGFILAKLVKDLSTLFFKKAGTDAYVRKLGIGAEDTEGKKPQGFSQVLGNILYFVIMIPVIISALNILNISAISVPAVAVLNSITSMIPLIIAAVILMALGIFLGKLSSELVYSITSVSGISESIAENLEDASAYRIDIAKILAETVRYIIIAVFTVQAMKVLKLELLDRAGTALLLYIPAVLSALVILAGGYILSALAKKFIKNTVPGGTFAGIITGWIIMGLAFLIALSRLGLATEFILPLYWLTLGAAAVAAALSFGLGGRDFARTRLEKLGSSLDSQDIEKTKNKIVGMEEEREKNLESQMTEARKEHEKRTEEIKEEIRKKEEAFENAKKELEEQRLKEEEEKRRKEEAERQRIENEKRRIEEEKRRREEEKTRLEEERRKQEEERKRLAEEERLKKEEEKVRHEKERLRIIEERERESVMNNENDENKKKEHSHENFTRVTIKDEGNFSGDSFRNEPSYARKDIETQSPPKLLETEKPADFVRNFTQDNKDIEVKPEENRISADYEVKSASDPEAQDISRSVLQESKEEDIEERIITDAERGEEVLLGEDKKDTLSDESE